MKKLFGVKSGKYRFELTDEGNNTYSFEYYFNKKENTVILKERKSDVNE